MIGIIFAEMNCRNRATTCSVIDDNDSHDGAEDFMALAWPSIGNVLVHELIE